jgi:hypothetical protein
LPESKNAVFLRKINNRMKYSCILFTPKDENGNPIHRSSFLVHRFLRMKSNILLSLLLLCNIGEIGANGYPISAIPENLKRDAFAVIRDKSISFKQADLRTGSCTFTSVITVFEEKGNRFASFGVQEDTFEELKNFSGEVFNAAGKSIKKIGKKDLRSTAYSTQLATDNKYTFYEYHPAAYPYTIKFEYEIRFKNGILIYPTFRPFSDFQVSLENADYLLQVPKDFEVRAKLNIVQEATKSVEKEFDIYKWSLKNVEALSLEKFAPKDELLPYALLSPAKFCIENACGNMSDWESFGQWQKELLDGRRQLLQKTIDKVLELTRGVSDKREKVKRLYEYMQQITHYESIQLGIGGWQPMKAEEVAKTGFGDCKGLTNFMKAMLDVVDIPSYYTVISLDLKRFFKDYPNFTQANHVILMVPLEKDSLWLECTSQILPFGYIHSSIAGHDALAVGDDKSFFCTLPSYPDVANRKINRINIRMNVDGSANMDIHSTYALSEYENMFYRLKGLSNKEENDVLGSLLRAHKIQISNIKKEESRTEQPRLDIRFTADCEDFASQTASRMFISANPMFTSLKGFLTGSSRRFDIVLEEGFLQTDTISIQMPEGYALETQPKTDGINSEFGNFNSEFIKDGNILKYIQTVEIKAGRYPAAQFENLKNFLSKVENLQSGKIGFKK